ncbi:MAG: hypothetical protein GXN92_00710 [Candidatus Micrarchaeota archaeon]|nr:hypothetical protein [Candidatus Micrarchaeota archaeon]
MGALGVIEKEETAEIKELLQSRMLTYIKDPEERKEALFDFVKDVFERLGIKRDPAKVTDYIWSRMDWSNADKAEERIIELLIEALTPPKEEVKPPKPPIEERTLQVETPKEEATSTEERKARTDVGITNQEYIFQQRKIEILGELLKGNIQVLDPKLVEEAKKAEDPIAFLVGYGFSEEEARYFVESEYPTLKGLWAQQNQDFPLYYYLAALVQAKEGKRVAPQVVIEPEEKAAPSQSPTTEEKSSLEHQYQYMFYMAGILNPSLNVRIPETIYGMSVLEFFGEMFGREFKSLEEVRRFVAQDPQNDVYQWAADLVDLMIRYGVDPNVSLGELKYMREQVELLKTAKSEKEFRNIWRELSPKEGTADMVLVLGGLDRKTIESMLENPVELPEGWQEKWFKDVPWFARYWLIKNLAPREDYILSTYTYYEMENGGYVIKPIENMGQVIEVLTRDRDVLYRHPRFYVVDIKPLIETSRNLDALEAKTLTIASFLEGLERSPKYRGFNFIVASQYIDFVAQKLYETEAALVRDVRESIAGKAGLSEGLLNYYDRAWNGVARVRLGSEETVVPPALDLQEALWGTVTGEIDPFKEQSWSVKAAIKGEREKTGRPITPEAQAYQPELIVKGLALNLVPLTEFVPKDYVYRGNRWIKLTAEGEIVAYSGDVKEGTEGVVTLRLVGTGSLVEATISGEQGDLQLNVIGQDLNYFGNEMDFALTWDRAGVDAEVKAELDKIQGNVAIVYKGRGSEKEFYIYYKDGQGNWYRVGRVWGDRANEWLMEMDTYIPGFANIFANLELKEGEGVFGVVGIDMKQLGVELELNKDSFGVIATYLLNPETLSIETILGERNNIPEIVYGGFVKGTVFAGGQMGDKNMVVAGDLALGELTGIRLVYENEDLAVVGVYTSYQGEQSLAFQAVAALGGVEWLAKYAAAKDAQTIVIKGKKGEQFIQFTRQYRFTEYARAQYVRHATLADQILEELVEKEGVLPTELPALLQNPDTSTSRGKLAAQAKSHLAKASAYGMFINATSYTSLLAQGEWGFAELLNLSIQGANMWVINAGAVLDNMKVGGTLGIGEGTMVGAWGVYTSAELAALVKLYLINLPSYQETNIKGVIETRLKNGKMGGIIGYIAQKTGGFSQNNFYIGFYREEGNIGFEVAANLKQEEGGESVGLGGKIYYNLEMGETPIKLTGEITGSWGYTSGVLVKAGVETQDLLGNDNLAVEVVAGTATRGDESNAVYGLGITYRKVW